MDTITHAMAGYVIVKSGLNKSTGRWGTAAGVTASLFPDIDGILGAFLNTESTILYHRYITNSLFIEPLYALFLAWFWVKVSKIPKLGTFFVISLVEMLAHNFLDLTNSYGTMIFSPFSRVRYALDWIFIIDLYLSLLLLLPIFMMIIWKKRAVAVAKVSLVMVALYMSLCAYNHAKAIDMAKSFAQEKNLKAVTIAALPQPLSPFYWGNYIMADNTIYEGLVNLIGRSGKKPGPTGDSFLEKMTAPYQSPADLAYREWVKFEESPWVQKALQLDGAKTFLWFARFPIARYRGIVEDAHTVVLYDLRFGRQTDRRPFQYTVKFDLTGKLIFSGYREDVGG